MFKVLALVLMASFAHADGAYTKITFSANAQGTSSAFPLFMSNTNLSSGSGAVDANTQRVTYATNGAGIFVTPSVGTASGTPAFVMLTGPVQVNTHAVAFQGGGNGVSVTSMSALVAGTAAIGSVGLSANGNGVSVTSIATGTNVIGGVNISFPVNTNALSLSKTALLGGITAIGAVKASAAVLMRVSVNVAGGITNTVAVHLYNSATAPITGTTSAFASIVGNGSQTGILECGPQGVAMATGLAYSVTANVPDSDTSTISAPCIINFIYK